MDCRIFRLPSIKTVTPRRRKFLLKTTKRSFRAARWFRILPTNLCEVATSLSDVYKLSPPGFPIHYAIDSRIYLWVLICSRKKELYYTMALLKTNRHDYSFRSYANNSARKDIGFILNPPLCTMFLDPLLSFPFHDDPKYDFNFMLPALCQPVDSAKCQNGGFPNPNNCMVCVCPSGYGGILCNERVWSLCSSFKITSTLAENFLVRNCPQYFTCLHVS